MYSFIPAPPSSVGKRYWRALSCPTYCSDDVDPVCGSDGVIYKNDCDMRKRTCNRGEFAETERKGLWYSSAVHEKGCNKGNYISGSDTAL